MCTAQDQLPQYIEPDSSFLSSVPVACVRPEHNTALFTTATPPYDWCF